MNSLSIKDLPCVETLDNKAMRLVHGGMFRFMPYWGPTVSIDKKSIDKSAEQLISQSQDVSSMNGNNIAFAEGIASRVGPTQRAHNHINF